MAGAPLGLKSPIKILSYHEMLSFSTEATPAECGHRGLKIQRRPHAVLEPSASCPLDLNDIDIWVCDRPMSFPTVILAADFYGR
jgi:hypothetical protein